MEKVPDKKKYRVKRVKAMAKIIHTNNKKICLFIGRTPDEPFPGFEQKKPMNEIWVSLSLSSYEMCGKQIHIKGGDTQAISQLSGLFDTVLVDWRVWQKSTSGLAKLLNPRSDSKLIVPTDFNRTMLSQTSKQKLQTLFKNTEYVTSKSLPYRYYDPNIPERKPPEIHPHVILSGLRVDQLSRIEQQGDLHGFILRFNN